MKFLSLCHVNLQQRQWSVQAGGNNASDAQGLSAPGGREGVGCVCVHWGLCVKAGVGVMGAKFVLLRATSPL